MAFHLSYDSGEDDSDDAAMNALLSGFRQSDNECTFCGDPNPTVGCRVCDDKYCSLDCRRQDFAVHRKKCGSKVATRNSTGSEVSEETDSEASDDSDDNNSYGNHKRAARHQYERAHLQNSQRRQRPPEVFHAERKPQRQPGQRQQSPRKPQRQPAQRQSQRQHQHQPQSKPNMASTKQSSAGGMDKGLRDTIANLVTQEIRLERQKQRGPSHISEDKIAKMVAEELRALKKKKEESGIVRHSSKHQGTISHLPPAPVSTKMQLQPPKRPHRQTSATYTESSDDGGERFLIDFDTPNDNMKPVTPSIDPGTPEAVYLVKFTSEESEYGLKNSPPTILGLDRFTSDENPYKSTSDENPYKSLKAEEDSLTNFSFRLDTPTIEAPLSTTKVSSPSESNPSTASMSSNEAIDPDKFDRVLQKPNVDIDSFDDEDDGEVVEEECFMITVDSPVRKSLQDIAGDSSTPTESNGHRNDSFDDSRMSISIVDLGSGPVMDNGRVSEIYLMASNHDRPSEVDEISFNPTSLLDNSLVPEDIPKPPGSDTKPHAVHNISVMQHQGGAKSPKSFNKAEAYEATEETVIVNRMSRQNLTPEGDFARDSKGSYFEERISISKNPEKSSNQPERLSYISSKETSILSDQNLECVVQEMKILKPERISFISSQPGSDENLRRLSYVSSTGSPDQSEKKIVQPERVSFIDASESHELEVKVLRPERISFISTAQESDTMNDDKDINERISIVSCKQENGPRVSLTENTYDQLELSERMSLEDKKPKALEMKYSSERISIVSSRDNYQESKLELSERVNSSEQPTSDAHLELKAPQSERVSFVSKQPADMRDSYDRQSAYNELERMTSFEQPTSHATHLEMNVSQPERISFVSSDNTPPTEDIRQSSHKQLDLSERRSVNEPAKSKPVPLFKKKKKVEKKSSITQLNTRLQKMKESRYDIDQLKQHWAVEKKPPAVQKAPKPPLQKPQHLQSNFDSNLGPTLVSPTNTDKTSGSVDRSSHLSNIEDGSRRSSSFVVRIARRSLDSLSATKRCATQSAKYGVRWTNKNHVHHCQVCHKPFSKLRLSVASRKHNCRRCGRVICSSCSPNRAVVESKSIIPRDDEDLHKRICVQCERE